jgi:hypothetical protein
MTAPIVDTAGKTVSHAGKTFVMRPLGEDEFTMLIDGVPVGRAVFSFGAPNAVPEKDTTLTEDELYAVAEAWFTATITPEE